MGSLVSQHLSFTSVFLHVSLFSSVLSMSLLPSHLTRFPFSFMFSIVFPFSCPFPSLPPSHRCLPSFGIFSSYCVSFSFALCQLLNIICSCSVVSFFASCFLLRGWYVVFFFFHVLPVVRSSSVRFFVPQVLFLCFSVSAFRPLPCCRVLALPLYLLLSLLVQMLSHCVSDFHSCFICSSGHNTSSLDIGRLYQFGGSMHSRPVRTHALTPSC